MKNKPQKFIFVVAARGLNYTKSDNKSENLNLTQMKTQKSETIESYSGWPLAELFTAYSLYFICSSQWQDSQVVSASMKLGIVFSSDWRDACVIDRLYSGSGVLGWFVDTAGAVRIAMKSITLGFV